MADDDTTLRSAELIRLQAQGCAALGSTLYGDLLHHAADDVLAGGPTSRLIAGRPVAAGPSALALRMMAGVHALVLSGRVPELARFYPSAGGEEDPGPDGARAWRALAAVLDNHRSEIRDWLERAPQTNEVGRAAALLGGLCRLLGETSLPVRLVEVGASAGLNLRADRFHLTGDGARYGHPTSEVRLLDAWHGRCPPVVPIDVVDRSGGDLSPIDPTTADGELALRAYVWCDQLERLERLRGAIALARRVPADLRREPALATVRRTALEPGTWTVLWHSVFRQYLSEDDRDELDAAIAALGASATPQARFAHLSLEPRRRAPDRPHEFLVTLTSWPGGLPRILGAAAPHGVPTSWE